MATVIDSNFILAVCAVFTLTLMIFGGFFSFVIMPVINRNSDAIKHLGEALQAQGDILYDHGKLIFKNSNDISAIGSKIDMHLEESK